MKKLKPIILVLFILLLVSVGFNFYRDVPPSKSDSFQSSSVAFPEIGSFMLQVNGQPADWLGVPLEGKKLLEPINVIIIDKLAKSEKEAIENLEAAMIKAGFPARTGHSADYQGLINNKSYPQLPEGKHLAFSDGHFEFDNDHGRVFGPDYYNNKYYFVAAFSREDIVLRGGVGHSFNSFNKARDQVAKKLDTLSEFNIIDFLPLKNYIVNNSNQTTGDHDGIAVVLSN